MSGSGPWSRRRPRTVLAPRRATLPHPLRTTGGPSRCSTVRLPPVPVVDAAGAPGAAGADAPTARRSPEADPGLPGNRSIGSGRLAADRRCDAGRRRHRSRRPRPRSVARLSRGPAFGAGAPLGPRCVRSPARPDLRLVPAPRRAEPAPSSVRPRRLRPPRSAGPTAAGPTRPGRAAGCAGASRARRTRRVCGAAIRSSVSGTVRSPPVVWDRVATAGLPPEAAPETPLPASHPNLPSLPHRATRPPRRPRMARPRLVAVRPGSAAVVLLAGLAGGWGLRVAARARPKATPVVRTPAAPPPRRPARPRQSAAAGGHRNLPTTSMTPRLVRHRRRHSRRPTDRCRPEAQADELAAQADYDRFRLLRGAVTRRRRPHWTSWTARSAAASPSVGCTPWRRDLWTPAVSRLSGGTPPTGIAPCPGLVAQAPVAQYLLEAKDLAPKPSAPPWSTNWVGSTTWPSPAGRSSIRGAMPSTSRPRRRGRRRLRGPRPLGDAGRSLVHRLRRPAVHRALARGRRPSAPTDLPQDISGAGRLARPNTWMPRPPNCRSSAAALAPFGTTGPSS